MLAKKQKVPKELIIPVMKSGCFLRSPHFIFNILGSKNLKVSRFLVIINKKTEKTAVARNRSKRLVYEVLRGILPEVKTTNEVILSIKKRVIDLSIAEISLEIKDIFKKNGLI